MANEKRLIDANAIPYEEHYVPDGDNKWKYKKEKCVCKSAIDKIPTVDAVEVVRCKDCKNSGQCSIQDAMNWTPKINIGDSFCSYGEGERMTFNKPPEWGKRFDFPENVQIEYNGVIGSLTSEIAIKMADCYDSAIVEQIAMEAMLAGVASCTVLNKAVIMDALNKQMPKKPVNIAKCELYGRCAVCGQTVHIGNQYCDQCGQSLDWSDFDA